MRIPTDLLFLHQSVRFIDLFIHALRQGRGIDKTIRSLLHILERKRRLRQSLRPGELRQDTGDSVPGELPSRVNLRVVQLCLGVPFQLHAAYFCLLKVKCFLVRVPHLRGAAPREHPVKLAVCPVVCVQYLGGGHEIQQGAGGAGAEAPTLLKGFAQDGLALDSLCSRTDRRSLLRSDSAAHERGLIKLVGGDRPPVLGHEVADYALVARHLGYPVHAVCDPGGSSVQRCRSDGEYCEPNHFLGELLHAGNHHVYRVTETGLVALDSEQASHEPAEALFRQLPNPAVVPSGLHDPEPDLGHYLQIVQDARQTNTPGRYDLLLVRALGGDFCEPRRNIVRLPDEGRMRRGQPLAYAGDAPGDLADNGLNGGTKRVHQRTAGSLREKLSVVVCEGHASRGRERLVRAHDVALHCLARVQGA